MSVKKQPKKRVKAGTSRYRLETPYVYALLDELGEVFYVGKGRRDRMYQHRLDAIRGKPGIKSEKIRSILAKGFDIDCMVLGEYETDQAACAAEIEFIASFDNLTNLTKGGESGPVDPRSQLIRAMQRIRDRMCSFEEWVLFAGDKAKSFATNNGKKTLREAYDFSVGFVDQQILDPSPQWAKGHPDRPGSTVFGY